MTLAVDTAQIERLVLRLRGLGQQIKRPAGIMRTIAQGVETQTRVRIHQEKHSPEGIPWRPWSAAYARTRNPARHSLLKDTWAMVEDLDSRSSATTATIFSNKPYAGRNQVTRPFLGLSEHNATDIERWLGRGLEAMYVEALKGLPAQ